MKKLFILISFLIIPLPAFCVTWGLLSEVEANPNSFYLIEKYSKGQEITYCLDEYFSDSPLDGKNLVEDSFNSWSSVTEKFIKESGREEEFKDILPILSRNVKLKQIPCGKVPQSVAEDKGGIFKKDNRKETSKEDIRFIIVPEGKTSTICSSGGSYGCYNSGIKDEQGNVVSPAVIFLRNKPSIVEVTTHEIGHAFGLSDQYLSARANSNPKYGTTKIYPSIMDSASAITCDDAEGFINALDCLALGNKRGGKEGWKSICKGSDEIYVNCSAKGREDFVNYNSKKEILSVSEYNPDGSLINTEEAKGPGTSTFFNPLTLSQDKLKALKRDKKGRVKSFSDADGTITRVDYISDTEFRLFTVEKNGDKNEVVGVSSISIVPGTIPGNTIIKVTNKFASAGEQKTSIILDKEGKPFSLISDTFLLENYKDPTVLEGGHISVGFRINKVLGENSFLIKYYSEKYKGYLVFLREKEYDFLSNCYADIKGYSFSCASFNASFDNKRVGKTALVLPKEVVSWIEFNEKEDNSAAHIKFKEQKNKKKAISEAYFGYFYFIKRIGYIENLKKNVDWLLGIDSKDKTDMKEELVKAVKSAQEKNN